MAQTAAPVHVVYASEIDADRQQRQVMSNIVRVFPRRAPLLALMDRLAEVSDGRNNLLEFQFLSEFPRTIVFSTTETAASTDFTVDSTAHVTESTILHDPVSGEDLLVLTIVTATNLTVGTRGLFGGGTPRAFAVDDELLVMGAAREEGDTRLAPIGIIPEQDSNSFQQFEHVYGLTDRVEQILHYGPTAGDLEAQNAVDEYKRRMERTFLFGFRDIAAVGTSGATTHQRFKMGGCRDFIDTYGDNVRDASGAFTYQELSRHMTETIREGDSQTKFGMAGRNVLRIISEWGLSYHQYNAFVTEQFGLEVHQLKGPDWKLNLVRNDQFETGEFVEWLMILDRSFLKHHVMRGLGDTVNRNVSGPTNDGDHTKRHQLTGVHTLEFNIGGAHGITKGITS